MKRLLLAVAFASASLSASALTVLQLNLEQLTALSDRVFVGRCVDVQPEGDYSGQRVQRVTFEVKEMLKGEAVETVTFRQLGLVDGGEEIGMKEGITIHGLDRDLPRYEVGEEAVVFLSAPGGSGLTAPVGLSQGKFAVLSDAAGKAVLNGAGNRGLFIGADKSPRMKALTQTLPNKAFLKKNGGPVPYADFVSLVKGLADQSK